MDLTLNYVLAPTLVLVSRGDEGRKCDVTVFKKEAKKCEILHLGAEKSDFSIINCFFRAFKAAHPSPSKGINISVSPFYAPAAFGFVLWEAAH